jgi:hypothetical protein
MKIEIKPVLKEVSNVYINLDILPELSKVIANVRYEGFTETEIVVIEGEEYNAWGSDDNYIYNLILSKSGLERN